MCGVVRTVGRFGGVRHGAPEPTVRPARTSSRRETSFATRGPALSSALGRMCRRARRGEDGCDADVDRHAGPAISVRARSAARAVEPPPPDRARAPAVHPRGDLHARGVRLQLAAVDLRPVDGVDDACSSTPSSPCCPPATGSGATASRRAAQPRRSDAGRSSGIAISCGETESVASQSVNAMPSRPSCSPAPPIASRCSGPGPRLTSWRLTPRRDADQLAALERRLLALDEQGERPLEHEVDLLLALVGVDAPALARVQHDLVEAEARDAELGAQAHEAVLGVRLQPRPGGPVLHGRDPTSPPPRRAAARCGRPRRPPRPRR